MDLRLFRHVLAYLLTGAVIAICVANPVEAETRKYFSSKLLCDVIKIGCAKKVSKARSSTKRVTSKKPTKQSSLETVPKSERKSTAMLVPDQLAAPAIAKFVPRCQPKPPMVQSDTSKVHAPLPEKPKSGVRHPDAESARSAYSINCRAELLELGVDFSAPNHVEGAGQCRVSDPVQLKSVQTPLGRVELSGRPTLNCAFARQFTIWLSDIAAPAAAALAEAKLASLSTGPGYQCRGRNGDSSAKISEHAFGNAIDIDGITLANNKRIEIPDVADKQDADYRMLMALRTSACGYFTTVLGPGANTAHASHYHFDMGVHGKSGNYRICK